MFTFYADPGHGWLEVSADDLAAVGLHPHDITRCSYVLDGMFYLEEDVDAGTFIDSWEKAHPDEEIYIVQNFQACKSGAPEIFIRRLPQLTGGKS